MSGHSPSQTRTSHAPASVVDGRAGLIEPFYRPPRLSAGSLASPSKPATSPMTSPHTPAASLATPAASTSPLVQGQPSIWSSRVPDHRNSVGALTPRYQTSYSFSGGATDSEAYRSGGAAWGAASQPQQRSYSDSGRFFGVVGAVGASNSPANSFSSSSTAPRRSSAGLGLGGNGGSLSGGSLSGGALSGGALNGGAPEPLIAPLLNARPATKTNFTGPAISLLDQFSSLASATRHAELTRRVDNISLGAPSLPSSGSSAGPSPAASAPGSPPSGLRRASLGATPAISPKPAKAAAWNPQSSSFVYAPQYTPPEHPQSQLTTSLSQTSLSQTSLSQTNPNQANLSAPAPQPQPRPSIHKDKIPESAEGRPPVRRRDYRRNVKHSELPLLEDLRTNRKTLSIASVLGSVLEVSTDQHGSRFIQENLAAAPPDVRAEFFAEATKNLLQLMMDVFGNYVIQQLFELGTMPQRSEMVRQMRGKVLVLSLQMYGCRVVQMALKYSAPADKVAVVNELDGHVVRCIKDHNGNHVIQKAVECISSEHVQFIYASLLERTVELSKHMYGCRVVQRILEHADETTKQKLLAILRDNITTLVEDQYGNYVVQHIVDHGPAADRQAVLVELMPHVLELSTHKYASNVVEKCFIRGSPRQRRDMIDRILITPSAPGSVPVVVSMIKDQYANYVVQKILGTAEADDRARLTAAIRPHLAALKRSAVGKHLATIERLVG